MDYKQYEELKYMLCEELEKIVEQGELTAGSLETVHKLTDTIKNVDKISMLEEGEYSYEDGMMMGGSSYRDDGRMSYRDGGMGGSSYRDGGQGGGRGGSSYRDGGSNRNNNSSYRRDGSSYREDGSSYRDNNSSYRRGRDRMGRFTSRDGATEHLMNKLGEMMNMADDKQREILQRAMRQIENA